MAAASRTTRNRSYCSSRKKQGGRSDDSKTHTRLKGNLSDFLTGLMVQIRIAGGYLECHQGDAYIQKV